MILRLRNTVEDVVDLLPGLLSWMLNDTLAGHL